MIRSQDGHEWTAEEFVRHQGHLMALEELADLLRGPFGCDSERVFALLTLRDQEATRRRGHTYPEGYDINEDFR